MSTISTAALAAEFQTNSDRALAVLLRHDVKPVREVKTASQTRRHWPAAQAREVMRQWRLVKPAEPAITKPAAEPEAPLAPLPIVAEPVAIVQEASAGISNANLFQLFTVISRRLAEIAEVNADTNRKLTNLMIEWGATEALGGGEAG